MKDVFESIVQGIGLLFIMCAVAYVVANLGLLLL